jgi:glucokinase
MIVADVGGTKTSVAYVDDEQNNNIELQNLQSYNSMDFDSFEAILRRYQQTTSHALDGQCSSIGVAGPILNNSCETTNLPWVVSGNAIKDEFKFKSLYLANDLVMQAYGLDQLQAKDIIYLNQGRTQVGNQALIAAGTGLGECILYFDMPRKRYFPFATEGGHTDFGPQDHDGIALLQWLHTRHQRVSWERVVSGSMGFANIYEFCSDILQINTPNTTPLPKHRHQFGPFVNEQAIKNCPLALKTMELFCRFYGGESGNLALKALAHGGIYIAGGIAPKIQRWLVDYPWFMEGFLNKGRFKNLLQDIPIRLICQQNIALKGAWRAELLASDQS